MYNAQVLVVEDDVQILDFVTYALRKEGFCHVGVSKAQDAINELAGGTFDIIILDIGLPDIDGITIIKTIREWSQIPIIVVSARCRSTDKVSALDSGADDYLTKPFSASELMARVRVALRHVRQKGGRSLQTTLHVGGLRIDFDKRLVYLDDREVHMTPLEYKLLSLFFHNIGKVLTTQIIISKIWGTAYETSALRVLMAGLRRKIEVNPAKPQYILTEIGVGYRLMDK